MLLDLYRHEKMTLEQLSAFTLTDDHAEQERIRNEMPSWNRHASYIRQTLMSEGVSATDKRVQFIGGLSEYAALGGAVKRDLFDGEDGG